MDKLQIVARLLEEKSKIEDSCMDFIVKEEPDDVLEVRLHWIEDGIVVDMNDLFAHVEVPGHTAMTAEELANEIYDKLITTRTWLGHIMKNARDMK